MTYPVKAEQLRHVISIQRQTSTRDGYGQPLDTWTDVAANIRAFVDPTGGSEFYAAQKVNAEATANVWIRYRSGLLPKMRVVFGSRTFDILNVSDLGEARKWIRLICKELI